MGERLSSAALTNSKTNWRLITSVCDLSLRPKSAFLAVLFGFNLLGEFQRALDPALKTYKQPATLRFEVFTCGAILGRSGHHLVLHMSKNWGGYSSRKPFFNSLLHWPPPTSPKFDPSIKNAA
jgi:hypothetical protein